MMGLLDGRVCVVTGAGRGLGREHALLLAAEGARVVVNDLGGAIDGSGEDSGPAHEVVDEIRAAGGEAIANTDSVTSWAGAQQLVLDAINAYGRLDVLVNNAGILRDRSLVNLEEAEWDAVIAVNLKGVFLCTRAVTPHMIAAGGGVVLNASSVVGLYGNFGQTNYVATKAGVIGMTQTWARELGKFKIRVNAVCPGFVATEILKAMPAKVLEGMVAHTPIGRMGEPEDIANAYVWLASDQAGFVHGAVLSVDGGLVTGT